MTPFELSLDDPLAERRKLAPESFWSSSFTIFVVRLADFFIPLFCAFLSWLIRFGDAPLQADFVLVSFLATIIFANLMSFRNVYEVERFTRPFYQVGEVLLCWTVTLLIVTSIAYATRSGADFSRLWAVIWFGSGALFLAAGRVVLSARMREVWQSGRLARSTLVVGTADQIAKVVGHLQQNPQLVRIDGVVVDDKRSLPDSMSWIPVLTSGRAIGDHANVYGKPFDSVVLAFPWDRQDRIDHWTAAMRVLPVDVALAPPVLLPSIVTRPIAEVGGVPMVNLMRRPLCETAIAIKRIEDVVLSALLLIAFALPMLIIAVLIWIDSPGPVLFRQARFGIGNRVFHIYKFRSMKVDRPEERDVPQATRADPRVTRLGRFLRRASLDELPQLINVLKGEMSLVGPRPHAVAHNIHFAKLIDSYLERHKVKPGITGWAQVNGLRGETDTLDKMESRVQYDLYYVENWSFAFDLKILFMTIGHFIGKQAY